MNYKYVVIGAGISGMTIAERLSSELGENVLVIEKRQEIGGNIYDYYNEYGILVHKYGPHIFHTNNKEVWDYISKFTSWIYYHHRVKAYVDGNYISIPINLQTLNQYYNLNLSINEMQSFIENLIPNNTIANNAEDFIINKIGKELYQKIYANYTWKQWGLPAKELSEDIVKRLPIRNNLDTRYFSDKYQGIPTNGYTNIFNNMLKNKNIKILLNTDYKEIIDCINYETLIYTGPIDYYFNYKYGKLKYRSIRFEFETFNKENYQSCATINYPNDYDFTRITEFKHLTGQNINLTTIVKEYPDDNGEELYPINTSKYNDTLSKYLEEAKLINTYFVGRLAEYKYYNMDSAIERALSVANTIINIERKKYE